MFAKLPVLIDQVAPGVTVAQLLDAQSYQGLGVSAEQALNQLHKQLHRELKRRRVSQLTTWQSASLHRKKFDVQPAIIFKERRYPAGPMVQLPVRYVELMDQREQLFCLLPDFGEFLYIAERELLTTLLSEAVHSITATLSPQDILELWPAAADELRWLRVNLPPPSSRTRLRQPRILSTVAEPLQGGKNLTMVAGARDDSLRQIREALIRGSCLVVGETGVGKTTLISHVARELHLARRTEIKQQRRKLMDSQPALPMFWLSSAGRLIAGMRYLGQWQQRLESLIAELANLDGVLAIENLLDLVSVGGREPRDSLAAFLIPYLRSGSLRLVSEANPTELDACRRLLPALVEALPVVRVAPLPVESEQELLRLTLNNHMQSSDTTFEPAIAACISRLCRQFQRHSAAPGPGMRFVQELLGRPGHPQQPKLWSASWILQQFSRRTGLPLALLDDAVPLDKKQVVDALSQHVIGQQQACEQAAHIVTRIKTALQDPRRPFGCLLLCGPTGVGKTQLAKSLSQYLFGATKDSNSLIRLDMSEYVGGSAGWRFLHDAHGHSAYWIQQIRSRPLSVVLLDEIEKASPEVFDILLSVLDEGRLTDRLGRVTSFRNSVIIMTSNLGVRSSSSLGFADDRAIDYVSEVKRAFRPEFFNRLDGVIPFFPLSHEVARLIVVKELTELNQREGLQRYGRSLGWTERLLQHLVRTGFHPNLGARPLQRTIEAEVVAPLSKWLVEQGSQLNSALRLDWEEKNRLLVVNSE